jgi:phospholipase A1
LKITISISRNILLSGDVLWSVLFCLALIPTAYASGEVFLSCAQQYPGDDTERLKCYDRLAAPTSALAPAPRENNASDEEAAVSTTAATFASAATLSAERSYLTRVWNLDDLSNRDASKLGRLQPYRQNYLLLKKTSKTNPQPSSPLADHNVITPNDIDASEIKFQFSVKADIGDQRNVDFLGIKTIRFWGTYTQQSNWQIFNTRNSSPFRETVYEPELIATLGTGYTSGLKLINLGWTHQSNGRPLPESRGWNRIYLLGGWEWNDLTSIMVRAWQRIPENSLKDDNPDIIDYLGRGDISIRWEPKDKSQAVAMLLRNNLRETNNRGYVQIDWATPVRFGSAARMHIQMSSGYGESLIDYNHRQNTIGLGMSFREW